MSDLTVSANVDTLLSAADNAAMRTALGLTALATTTPGTNVATFLATPTGANLASALTTALPATKGGTGLTSLGTGVATALGVNVGSAGAPVVFNGDAGTPSALILTNATMPKVDVLQAPEFAADAGANDTYAITLSPAPSAYVTGARYRFKANTANTGAATLNVNSLGAKTIVKLQGAITTTLADNDIRAGQWVEVVYDGTNLQMVSALGNSPSASITGSDKQVTFFDGANNPAGNSGLTFDKATNTLTLGAGGSTAGVAEFGQGTAPSDGTNSVKIYADTGVTSYKIKLPAAVGSTGFLQWSVSGTTVTLSSVTQLPSNATVDGTNSVGFRNLPQNAKTGSYTLLATDLGKIIPNTTGGWTVNNSVHTAGDVISLYNDSGSSQNITAGTITTMRLAGTATTGTRALAARGLATLYFQTATEVIVSGVGVT